MLLPPWFQAPLGAIQWSRYWKQNSSATKLDIHLHFTQAEDRRVPVGYQAVVSAAFVCLAEKNPLTDWSVWDYEDSYWQLYDDEAGLNLSPRLPFAIGRATADWNASVNAYNDVNHLVTPCPPLIAPIVIPEGHRAFLRSVNNMAGTTMVHFGWLTGWIAPKVNEVPGARSYFTDRLT